MLIKPKPLKFLRKSTKWNKGKKILQTKILELVCPKAAMLVFVEHYKCSEIKDHVLLSHIYCPKHIELYLEGKYEGKVNWEY